ncbi:MAG TPA: DNA repair protein RadA, partial [Actinobacteria bacterium]|nr:DNA repair protein RadA [Actinomycetota bacterium]
MKYLCSTCGHRSAKWMGFCPQCGSRKALVEDQTTRRATPPEVVPVASAAALAADRSPVGIGEIDRVLGGGVVPGAVLLLGGEPGVGKSTLLLQAAGSFAETGCSVLIATAEESSHQVGLRAKRLGVDSSRVSLVADSDIDAILAAADTMRPDLLIVDSIQAVSASGVGSVPGSVSQVRECAARVIQYAKARATAAVL